MPGTSRRESRVLTTRPRLRKWITLENATLFIDTIEAAVDLVADAEEVNTETRDPNDDYLIALATWTPSSRATRTSWNGRKQRTSAMTPTQFDDRGSTT